MARVLKVDARWARLTVQLLKERRVPIDPVLKEVGLTRVQVSDPDERIPFHKHAALLEVAARLTGDRCFGIHLGVTVDPKQAGALGYVALSSMTLGDALSNFARYLHVLTEGSELEIERQGDHAALTSLIIDPQTSDKLQVSLSLPDSSASAAQSLGRRLSQVGSSFGTRSQGMRASMSESLARLFALVRKETRSF